MKIKIQLICAFLTSFFMFFYAGSSKWSFASYGYDSLIADMTSEVYYTLDTSLTDKESFIEDFEAYHDDTRARIVYILEDLAEIIRHYADSENGMIESSERLVEELNTFYSGVDEIIAEFPRKEEVLSILEPVVTHYLNYVKSQFPQIEPPSPQGNPLDNIIKFYNETQARNPFELGPFFMLEPLLNMLREKTYYERSEEITHEGYLSKRIIFREEKTIENGELIMHRIIREDDIVHDYSKPEEFSFLHSLPAKLREGGGDERVALLMEELINLANYYLLANVEENGLYIPDDVQLNVPEGYTPDIFVGNFIGILLSFYPA
ncbi:MAG: hypothetical protein HQL27_07300 [Candidatus Omnitrophica bacterium]|nr:hypothetical protein [Candidatus Omnitrophota bacterium]